MPQACCQLQRRSAPADPGWRAPGQCRRRIVAAIRSRERNGLVDLPRPPRFKRGDAVRILEGPFADRIGLYQGMKPRERVEVLLAILGGAERVTLAADLVEQAQ